MGLGCLKNSRCVGIGKSKKKSSPERAEMRQAWSSQILGASQVRERLGFSSEMGTYFFFFLRKGNFKRKK